MTVRIVNAESAEMVAIAALGIEEGRLYIDGTVMGAWPSRMFLEPGDVKSMVGMILRKPSVIGYALKVLLTPGASGKAA